MTTDLISTKGHIKMAVLLDRFGKPVKTSNLTKEDASCLIGGVRTHESGYPSFGLTPKKLSSLLRSADEGDMDAYLDLAEEMEEKEVVIRIRHLSKEYRLGVIGRGTLQRDLQSWWARKRGKPDPNQ